MSNAIPVIDRLQAAQTLLETIAIHVVGRDWQIITVSNQSALIQLAQEGDNIPYGYLLWESALGLANLLSEQPHLVQGKRVLELGAGVGLPGLVAAGLGADVWQTDHEDGVLVLSQRNAALNGIEGIHTFVADWRRWDHEQQYDLILGADIVYDRSVWEFLEPIFLRNLRADGQILLADPGRAYTLGFIAHLEKRGWVVDLSITPITLPMTETPQKAVDVSLFTIRPSVKATQ